MILATATGALYQAVGVVAMTAATVLANMWFDFGSLTPVYMKKYSNLTTHKKRKIS
mgnify:CR=1 FL=1